MFLGCRGGSGTQGLYTNVLSLRFRFKAFLPIQLGPLKSFNFDGQLRKICADMRSNRSAERTGVRCFNWSGEF